MTAMSRDELREHLVAVIEAAPDLSKENREHLADVFFDRLTEDYDLVPHGTRGTSRVPQPDKPASRWARTPLWVKVVLLLAFLIFVVPAVIHHFPIFLLVVVAVFFVVKRARSRRASTATFV